MTALDPHAPLGHLTATPEFAAVVAAQASAQEHLAAAVPHVLAALRAEADLNAHLGPLADQARDLFTDASDPQAAAFDALWGLAGDEPVVDGLCLSGALSLALQVGGPGAIDLTTRIAQTLGGRS